jgi:hypothetical protein
MMTDLRTARRGAIALTLAALASSGATQSPSRGIRLHATPDKSAQVRQLDLSVRFDRDDPVYALGEQMTLTIRTARAAMVRLWEIYPDRSIRWVGNGACFKTNAGVPLTFPPSGTITVGKPLGITELHIQALDPTLAKPFCSVTRSWRTSGATTSLALGSQMQETILRYRVVQP